MSNTETSSPRFTDEYIAANRLAYNDVSEQDGTGEGYWFVMIERDVETEGKGCACGCGIAVRSARREFQPGHDQRLMGILVRADREGLEVSWSEGGMVVTGQGAMSYGELVLGETGRAKLAGYLANTPKRAKRRTTAAQAAEVIDAPVGPKTQRVRDRIAEEQAKTARTLPTTVKIGRWEYPVLDVSYDGDKIVAVRYQNKRKEEVVTYTWGKLS